MTKAVTITDLWKTFIVADGTFDALRGAEFSINKGELVGLVGASGSGKSTLLHILGALDTPSRGQVRIEGFNPFAGTDNAISKFRNTHIGFVFQRNNLLSEFTALENVIIPGLIAGKSENHVKKHALELLQNVGMSHRITHYPGQLSGGEQQRVAIARALINSPTLILADEPTGNLDSQNATKIHDLFLDINRVFSSTIIIVTHNMSLVSILPRVLEIRDGSIISDTINPLS